MELDPEAAPEADPVGGAGAAPDVTAEAEEEVGAGVVLGVDLGEAASKLRSFSCILRMTAVGVKDTETELLENFIKSPLNCVFGPKIISAHVCILHK